MADQYPLEGGCDCGACRYALQSAPLFVHCCHCRWCQRESGSAFALNAIIESDRLVLRQGETNAVVVPSQSGKGQTFVRCSNCQTALWSNYAGAGPHFHFLRVGTLDNPDVLEPDIHIYTESKQPWVRLPDHKPAMPGYYRIAEHWPADAVARRQAHKEKMAAAG